MPILVTVIGLIGVYFNEQNLLKLMMCLELSFLGVGVLAILVSLLKFNVYGQIIALVILTIAAAEAAVGLSILVVTYRVNNSISLAELNKLRG